MQPPFYYDSRNLASSIVQPSTIHIQSTPLSHFFRRYLMQRAISVFKWDGIPDNWSKDYFLYTLYGFGFVAVVNTDKFGVIPQACGLYGYDVFYRPTNAVIANPLLSGILRPRIGTECELVRLTPDYGGILDLVSYYGDMLALCAESAGMNLFNSHLSYVFFASDKTAAESYKKMYDQISRGEVAVVIDRKLQREDSGKSWDAFSQNLKENFIAGDVYQVMRTIENHFDTEMGIPNANTEKKERQIVDEVNANNAETQTRADLMLEQLQQSCKRVNAMFGLDLSVDWRYVQKEVQSGGKPIDHGTVSVQPANT